MGGLEELLKNILALAVIEREGDAARDGDERRERRGLMGGGVFTGGDLLHS